MMAINGITGTNATLQNNPLWHKNSSLEETFGSYHANKTNYAYFADPMEPISDAIKERADFIVYDNEPAYPDIDEVSTNYFGRLRKNFRESFEEVRNYFYRREMAGFADIREAKEKQREAATLTGLYDKAGDLRYRKETTEDEIKTLEAERTRLDGLRKIAETKLLNEQATKAHIEKHTENLTKLRKPYEELISVSAEGSSNETAMLHRVKNHKSHMEYSLAEQGEKNQTQLAALNAAIKRCETLRNRCVETINGLKANILKLEADIATTKEGIASKTSLVEEFKAKLIPLFDELKNFYAKRGIKGVKGL